MTITGLHFFIFAAITWTIYYLSPRKYQNAILLAASLGFIASWNFQSVVLLVGLTVVNYLLARLISRENKNSNIQVYSGIAVNVVALFILKYGSPSGLLKDGWLLLVPIGLSFYVVQAIAYLIDLNRGVVKFISNPVDFALFMLYFPKMVSGPIERVGNFLPHLHERRDLDLTNYPEYFVLVIQGLMRKLVIANLLFLILPTNLFQNPLEYTASELVLWLIAYSFAIYNDFAGYTSIARGVSGFFGIPLSKNFNLPYFSKNPNEFWQRWHITLSEWLRDYIFFPTTRFLLKKKISRTHAISIILPPMMTMLVSALWHGVSWHMLLWGGMHGIYLVGERLWFLYQPQNADAAPSRLQSIASQVLIFILVSLAWVPFNADVSATFQYIGAMLSPQNWITALSSVNASFILFALDVTFLVGLSLTLDVLQKRFGELMILRTPIVVQALVINIAVWLLVIANMATHAPPPFVYQGF